MQPAELLQSPLYSRSSQDALKIAERLAASTRRRRGSTDIPRLVAETGLSAPAITQVVYFLQRAKLLKARSSTGAVELARPPEKISMLDVVTAIDGRQLWTRCLLGLAQCSDETPCPAHSVWKEARGMLERQLESQSIADLSRVVLEKRGGRRRPSAPIGSAKHS